MSNNPQMSSPHMTTQGPNMTTQGPNTTMTTQGPRDHLETRYFVSVMTLFEPPRTYGPFDTQAAAETWARTHLAIGLQWFCTTGEVVVPDKPPVNPPKPTPGPVPGPAPTPQPSSGQPNPPQPRPQGRR